MRKVLPAILLVVALAVVVVRAQCRHKDGEVTLPPVTAGPVEVVTAYVTALDQHDIATAKALATPQHVAQTERAEDSWYRNVRSITGLWVGEPHPRGPDAGQTAAGSREAVDVDVEFTLDQCDEESIEDGVMSWGYLLSRESPNDRWLVTGEGHG